MELLKTLAEHQQLIPLVEKVTNTIIFVCIDACCPKEVLSCITKGRNVCCYMFQIRNWQMVTRLQHGFTWWMLFWDHSENRILSEQFERCPLDGRKGLYYRGVLLGETKVGSYDLNDGHCLANLQTHHNVMDCTCFQPWYYHSVIKAYWFCSVTWLCSSFYHVPTAQ